jgi:uncharacterized protein (DUF1800 family)
MAVWNYENAAHLLRRAGFGGTPAEIQAFLGRNASVNEAVAELLSFKPSRKKPPGPKSVDFDNLLKMRIWWFKVLATGKTPGDSVREKLVLFWHNHLVSGASKQPELRFNSLQNQLFRVFAKGNFKNLIREFNRDAANLYYLDGITNVASTDGDHDPPYATPNENWGREVMELFTLGVFQVSDGTGGAPPAGLPDPAKPNYTENDVHNLARASTGWTNLRSNKGVWDRGDWDDGQTYDDNADGVVDPVVIFGQQGSGDSWRIDDGAIGTGYDVLDLLFSRVDANGNNQVGMFMAKKFWTAYAYPPPAPTLETGGGSLYDLFAEFAAVFSSGNFEVEPLLQAMWTHDEFYSNRAKSRTVRSPVDFIVGSLRSLGVAKSDGKTIGNNNEEIAEHAEQMGQALFEPPNVAGWTGGLNWINSGTLLSRLDFARQLASADFGRNKVDLRRIQGLIGVATTPAQVVDAVVHQLGLDLGPAALTTAQKTDLENYLTTSPPPFDLSSDQTDYAQEKVRGLISLALQCAEQQIF